ncbi:WSC domain-containing protein [Xylariomycetidae sp. FL2044]|nr:WSC domain-containing protein [Xylariomycetidae sp. FL2044]
MVNLRTYLVVLAALQHANAFFRMSCSLIQTGRLDPIVHPGAVSPHVHKVSGGSNFGPSVTTESLLASRCTSCEVQADKSAYWTPQLYYQYRNGSLVDVPNGGTVVYYLGRGENRSNTEPFPPGFRMLSGNPYLRSNDTNTMTYSDPSKRIPGRLVSDRVSFACLDSSGALPEHNYMFRTECDNGMRAQIQFPTCWDGRDYQPDQSHVAYMSQIDNGVCPPTHPRQLIHLFFEVIYGVNDVRKEPGGRFVFANGDPTGFGFHGDFFNGWDATVLQDAIAQCVNNDNINGQISLCPPLVKSQTPYYSTNCPERPSIVDEKVKGLLPKLPGCNNITIGPEIAVQATCPNDQTPDILSTSGDNGTSWGMYEPVIGQKLSTSSPWAFAGCAADNTSKRALTGYATSANNMTIEICTAACRKAGFALAGLEYSRECYCGATLPAAVLPLSNCTGTPRMACAGNTTEWCGGSRLLTVWNDTSAAAPTERAGGSSLAANGTAFYLGCYTDSGPRTLSGDSYSSDAMTVDTCASFCQKRNFANFGVEYGRECYCGNGARPGAASAPETDCNMPCKGDASRMCGAGSRISVWNSTLYTPTRSPASVNGGRFTYLACYTEGSSGRALGAGSRGGGDFLGDGALTVERCATYCAGKGYAYMGVGYGQECYCNNDGPINGAVTAPETDCGMTCKGDITEWCGGASRINVYKAGGGGAVEG